MDIWKSAGDNEKHKHDFSYDNVNRLTAADFNQYTGNAFNKTAGLDFSVSNLSFDANGNIMTMNQKGWKLTGSIIAQVCEVVVGIMLGTSTQRFNAMLHTYTS